MTVKILDILGNTSQSLKTLEASTITSALRLIFLMKRSTACVLFLFCLWGCVDQRKSAEFGVYGPENCSVIKEEMDWDDAIRSLNGISRLYRVREPVGWHDLKSAGTI